MKMYVLAFALGLLVLTGCASQFAYNGPIHQKEPVIETIVHRTVEVGGQVKTTSILKIINTSDRDITADVQCEGALTTGIKIPARTYQLYLPHRDDSWCEVGSWALSQ